MWSNTVVRHYNKLCIESMPWAKHEKQKKKIMKRNRKKRCFAKRALRPNEQVLEPPLRSISACEWCQGAIRKVLKNISAFQERQCRSPKKRQGLLENHAKCSCDVLQGNQQTTYSSSVFFHKTPNYCPQPTVLSSRTQSNLAARFGIWPNLGHVQTLGWP